MLPRRCPTWTMTSPGAVIHAPCRDSDGLRCIAKLRCNASEGEFEVFLADRSLRTERLPEAFAQSIILPFRCQNVANVHLVARVARPFFKLSW